MKTFFRYANLGLLVVAFIAMGVVAGVAQNPCEDADGITALDAKFRELLAKKPQTLDDRKATIDAGKQYLEKYGACDSTKEMSDYLKDRIPKLEDLYKKAVLDEDKKQLTIRFDTALKAKNWDDVYSSGKEILAKYPDDFRAAELVLGSIGYDESTDHSNTKYNDDTLKYAKQSLADLEGGKTFKAFGVPPFTYTNKDDAIAWMNLTIGYLLQVGSKDKVAAAPYLYKATQATASKTSENATPYAFIGAFYFDKLNKQVEQIKTAEAAQSATDTPEVAQKKVDDIKAMVAQLNGTSERAMDAFSRAFNLSKAPAFKTTMKKNVEDAYQIRFGKKDGLDAWIASTIAKPFPNPTSPIAPISDPEPVKTDATTTPPGTAPATPAKPGTTPAPKPTTVIKPATPGAKPGPGK